MNVCIVDTEVCPDYFLLVGYTDEGFSKFELYDGHPLDVEGMVEYLSNYILVTFNGNRFDLPIIMCAITYPRNNVIKELCDYLISGGLWWKWKMPLKPSVFSSHIDIMCIAPGYGGLKVYGARMHTKRIHSLPATDDRELIVKYCVNDCIITKELYLALLPEIQLRHDLSVLHQSDFMSKSWASISEHLFRKELGNFSPCDISRFKYHSPAYIKFDSDNLQRLLAITNSVEFRVVNGRVLLPDELKNLTITINEGWYNVGIGGLHSCEKSKSYVSTPRQTIVDVDVISYYPQTIINNGYYPKHIGKDFLRLYKRLTEERLEAKAKGQRLVAETYKKMINSAYGKSGDKHSILFYPPMMIFTTLTGQLSILMLIERLEASGVKVVTANTDGLTYVTSHNCDDIIRQWERETGYTMEANDYSSLHIQSNANYFARKADGSVKKKGCFRVGKGQLDKNPNADICYIAAMEFVLRNTSVEDTILNCKDIREFICIRRVDGGAMRDGEQYGTIIRWYYGISQVGAVYYQCNNYKVPCTEGAIVCEVLPSSIPTNLDYQWYINKANSILSTLG